MAKCNQLTALPFTGLTVTFVGIFIPFSWCRKHEHQIAEVSVYLCVDLFRSERDEYLLEFARDDVQLVVNELWKV